MKILVLAVIVMSLSIRGSSQMLNKVVPTADDKRNGVVLKFGYSATDSHGVIWLILKKDSSYFYSLNTAGLYKVSEGKWSIYKDVLTLESTLQMDNIPAKISYDQSGTFADSFNVAIVKNIKNELLTDAFVLINSDSIKCLPMIGDCNGSFERINKVKILFENGMSSKWMMVKEGAGKIQLTVLTDTFIGNYHVMHHQKFKVSRDRLIYQ
ncbi:hypothetical protein [Chitinophaga varians]|uniref:hypothetical protein n=1 Tax=Chitinophaga varians TaxID=2202339 RepID=UPI00165F7048|nr:hypothetical protein [Chitinophaga varians]MBC9914026.1 hypothetical protein [Chitinophaga varians]